MEIATSGFQREANTQALADKALSLRPVVLQGYGASNESSASRAGLYQRSGKRLFDLAFSAAFLVLVASWLFPVIALLIRLDSKGPILFRQRRVGLNGETFECLKFRTMRHDPEGKFVQAQKDDPRITRVGAFLRKTNLDEVPQFINVMHGEMSVVGPRPHVPDLDHKFCDVVPGYLARNAVKPGVTGLAQVSGCRGETRSVREMTHRIRFDIFYTRNVSLFIDLKIIVLTVMRVLQGDRKAY
jgi:putative colanic acid biosynthesis UDP-glucose lipid carrier transferase